MQWSLYGVADLPGRRTLVGAYARSPAYSWAPARTLGRSIDARTQQKTSALGKPDADLFRARIDANHEPK